MGFVISNGSRICSQNRTMRHRPAVRSSSCTQHASIPNVISTAPPTQKGNVLHDPPGGYRNDVSDNDRPPIFSPSLLDTDFPGGNQILVSPKTGRLGVKGNNSNSTGQDHQTQRAQTGLWLTGCDRTYDFIPLFIPTFQLSSRPITKSADAGPLDLSRGMIIRIHIFYEVLVYVWIP